ncbi:hypothetical protein Hypma_010163 [Hypsizygus marmoreus]|uniref:Uncharacterized protein n=1 Tax=Hypsizygus marmoreus TaxID=39966 RepID=A0A369JNC0_HYPMA|nr:hypothetical protein Hypma_010163 [Hypsizygus marmoreus]
MFNFFFYATSGSLVQRRPYSEPYRSQHAIVYDKIPRAHYPSFDVNHKYHCPNPACDINEQHTFYSGRLIEPCKGYPWVPLTRFDARDRPMDDENYWLAVEGEGAMPFVAQEGEKVYLFGYGLVTLRDPRSFGVGWTAFRCDYPNGNPATTVVFREQEAWSVTIFGIRFIIGRGLL